MSGEPLYSDQEAEEILRLAARGSGDGISRERLTQMAAELGVSPDALAQAEQTVRSQREETNERNEFELSLKKSFYYQFMSYLVTCTAMVGFNLISDGHVSWALWVVGGWGLGVAKQAMNVFMRGGDGYNQEFEKWRNNRRRAIERASGLRTEIVIKSGNPLGSDSENLVLRLEAMIQRENLHKLEAIKLVRDETGLGLKEAKDVVDEMARRNPATFRD